MTNQQPPPRRPNPLLDGQDPAVANDRSLNAGYYFGKDRRERWARDIYIENLKTIRDIERTGKEAWQTRGMFKINGEVTDERIAKAEMDNERINRETKEWNKVRKQQARETRPRGFRIRKPF